MIFGIPIIVLLKIYLLPICYICGTPKKFLVPLSFRILTKNLAVKK